MKNIKWEFAHWIDRATREARIEGEHEGKFYTARSFWINEEAFEPVEIEEINEHELHNQPREIKKVNI